MKVLQRNQSASTGNDYPGSENRGAIRGSLFFQAVNESLERKENRDG